MARLEELQFGGGHDVRDLGGQLGPGQDVVTARQHERWLPDAGKSGERVVAVARGRRGREAVEVGGGRGPELGDGLRMCGEEARRHGEQQQAVHQLCGAAFPGQRSPVLEQDVQERVAAPP